MCGICGTAGFIDEALLHNMTDLVAHRGPDDSGIFISERARVGLGNRRLSIIDLSPAGHMPMASEDETIWITYNGEIYNYIELREVLEGLGHKFRSRSDTEVLIHGYEQWGVDLLPRLNGMFALALLDLGQKGGARPKLLLARDRFGIKPLYYLPLGERLLFASEIKSILLHDEVRRELNPQALQRFLTFLWVPGPETLFNGIRQLQPGHYLTWEAGRFSEQAFWEMEFRTGGTQSEGDLVRDLQRILRDSVKRHLRSDVPLGVFLSGGIDSSTVLALASQTSGQMKAYTIAYRDEDAQLEQSADDPKYARLVAQHFGAEYHEIVVEPEIVDLLPKVVWHLDQPVADPAAISTLLICEAARPSLKVLLSGQGADEIFAGYRVHLGHRLAERLRVLPAPLRRVIRKTLGVLPVLKDRIPGLHPGLALAAFRYADRLLESADLPPEMRYVKSRSYFREAELEQLFAPQMRERLGVSVVGEPYFRHFSKVAGEDFIHQMLYVDAKTFLPDLNLAYCDKLSSAASVEVRVPFLDTELCDFLAGVPSRLKLNGLRSKYILKKAMEGTLPESVIRRRKAGFGAPIRKWLRYDLQELLSDSLSAETIGKRGYFDVSAVQRLVDDHKNGVRDNTYKIWALLTFEIWLQTFLDGISSRTDLQSCQPALQAGHRSEVV